MSNMLEQAIIDADSLKEAARQSAEEKIVEHFSKDIKEAVNMILEQEVAPGDLSTMAATSPYDPTMMDPTMMGDPTAMGTPAAPSMVDIEADKNTKDNGKFVVDQLPYATTTDSKTFVSIDLDRLEESIREGLEENALDSLHLEEEYDLEEATLLDEDSLVESDDEDDDDDDNTTNESIEKMIRSVLAEEMEDLFESDDEESDDEESDEEESDEEESDEEESDEEESDEEDKDNKDKGNGLTAAQKKLPRGLQDAIANKKVKKESVELKTKNKTLITEQKTLNKKVSLLEGKLEKYGTVIEKLKDKLNETNLANAKLLYQNRVLDSDSLNERQKDRIVETIMNAKTVEEAKIIYETLQSAVGANSLTRRPKSLNEVVTKRSSAFMPRKEEKRVDPFTARMKALAGIKD